MNNNKIKLKEDKIDEFHYRQYLTNQSLYYLLKRYKLKTISNQTGIPQSTLKNYKYEKYDIKQMPLYIAQKLTKIVQKGLKDNEKNTKKDNKMDNNNK